MTDVTAQIARWQAGDERAAEALYDHHRERTFRLAYGLLGDRADAEEASQDALAYALSNIDRFDPQRASFSTWLHTITVSRCRDLYRRQRLRRLPLAGLFGQRKEAADPGAGQEQRLVRAETHNEVWKAVQSLSPRLREAVLLRFWAGHTYREMGDVLGCPISTAQSRVRLAFDQLRVILSPQDLVDLSHAEEEVMR
jgi:RNA polymerase sigma-70 factor (ECF subfamily)